MAGDKNIRFLSLDAVETRVRAHSTIFPITSFSFSGNFNRLYLHLYLGTYNNVQKRSLFAGDGE